MTLYYYGLTIVLTLCYTMALAHWLLHPGDV